VEHDSPRWVEVTPSQFPHEAEGLRIVRGLLPDSPPYRAWSNFEFRDSHGKWHEIDLLVLGRRRLHLVELKYYAGELQGDDLWWRRDGHRAEDSPLKLTRRKAQRLATKLRGELTIWARENNEPLPDLRTVIPYVQEAVFLHNPGLRCRLPKASQIDLFGLDDAQDMGLESISTRLLEPPTAQHSVGPNGSDIIAALLARIGLVQRRQREVGSWVIDEQPLAEGEGWQDWPAFHRVATTDRARIRFYVAPPGAASTERVRLRRVAEHEYRLTTRLQHDGLIKPRDVVENELGTGVVYPHDKRFQRLDLWLADHRDGLPVATQLALLRQIAETLAYAHRHRVVHRGLSPMAVRVRTSTTGELKVLLGDWQTAGRASGGAMTGVSSSGLTDLGDGSGPAADRLRAIMQPAIDVDRRFIEVFQAPEGVWNRSADRIRLDVFALGTLSYYLLTGRPPASDRTALRQRLQREGGLDLAVDMPQISPAVRRLVLEATRPAVSARASDVRTFLAQLAEAERELAAPEDKVAEDPLEAMPEAVIGGRFQLERRLGAGSTAVGLLVTDLRAGESGQLRVLKVARDDAAGQRLADEAEVLRRLEPHRRLARLIEGPLVLGGRRALLIEYAGEQTLAEVLRERNRLSLDLLERWGTELLEALVALDKAGVDHRDIKPANLGVREGRGDRVKHLVLFDFSLARTGAGTVNAGTPPYLDPFMEERGRYDSAAERYAAAAVLFEMATGSTPSYGDGQTDPLVITDEATVDPDMFDAAVAPALVGFFRTALARTARERHHTAADMLAEWRAAFASLAKTAPADADQRAAAARAETPLAEAGLSARALSALEPLGVATVADLLAVDPVRLNHLSGVANATRREITSRAKEWRARLGAPSVRRRPDSGTTLPDPLSAAERLVEAAGTTKAKARRRAARLLLGLEEGLDPFAPVGELARALDATPGRGSQLLSGLQEAWARSQRTCELLDSLAAIAGESIARLGKVASVEEIVEEVSGQLPPSEHPAADRLVAGLLRLSLDRADELARAEGLDADEARVSRRRRGGKVMLLATDEALLDAVESAARTAKRLVTEAQAAGEPLVTRQRAAEELLGAAMRVAEEAREVGGDRLVRLAARLSPSVAASGHGELHDRDMTLVDALRIGLRGLGERQLMPAQELRDRVRARFPALPAAPERPRLDELVAAAGLPLVYDETLRAYRAPSRPSDTTGLGTRPVTAFALPVGLDVSAGYVARRLRESLRARSFLALGVDALHVDRAVDLMRRRHDAEVVDVTQVLIDGLRNRAGTAGVPWDVVQAADSAQPGSRDALGLAALVEQSLPDVEAALTKASAGTGDRPIVLVDLAPLARYGHLNLLSRWADLTAPRRRAIWAVVPQLIGNQGPLIDGRPLPLAAPGQFIRLDSDWLADRTDDEPAATGAGDGARKGAIT
jgi:serine/threonine protein kinase